MKKIKIILASLVVSLGLISLANGSESIVYYEDYDLDVAVGLKAGQETSENKKEKSEEESEITNKTEEVDETTSKSDENQASSTSKSQSSSSFAYDGDIPIINQKQAWISSGRKNYLADVTDGPIKGNTSSKIYHSPGQRDYNKISVDNVVWFSTEKAASDAGYSPAKR